MPLKWIPWVIDNLLTLGAVSFHNQHYVYWGNNTIFFSIFLCLDSEAEWESLNQDWLTLAHTCSQVPFRSHEKKRRPSFPIS